MLCGNEVVYSQLTGGGRAAGFAQLYSRIGRRVKLNRLPLADIEPIAGAWSLDDSKTISLLHKYCDRKGGLRLATKLLVQGTMLANANSEELGVSHIRSAWNELGAVQ